MDTVTFGDIEVTCAIAAPVGTDEWTMECGVSEWLAVAFVAAFRSRACASLRIAGRQVAENAAIIGLDIAARRDVPGVYVLRARWLAIQPIRFAA